MGPSFNRHAGAIDWIQSRFRAGRLATLYFDEVRSCTYCDDLNRVFERFLAGDECGLYHAGGPRANTLYQIAQVVNRVGDYDPALLKGCPRLEAGPMPPRAGNVSLDSARLGDTTVSVRDVGATASASLPARVLASPSGSPAQCAVPSMADQRACLQALVAVSDAPLQRVYDSLITETRRHAVVPTDASDPPAVTQLRMEQRRWVADRARECTRDPAPGFVPLWAEPISGCFARMSAARQDELRSALGRVKGEPR